MKHLLAVFLAAGLPCWAQLDGFSKEQLVKYTAQNPFERSSDGRPNVPGQYLQGLQNASSEMIWGALRRAGYDHQWEGGWKIIHPEKKLIGRVVTAQFMPIRPDVNDVIEADARAQGLGRNNNQRVIDGLQSGDVLVVDVFGKVEQGPFAGDNLTTAIHAATGNGYIVNGTIRDLDGIYPLNIPIYVRDFHVSALGEVMLSGVNVPIRIGNVTVMPGDVVVGDREGLSFIPPHLVADVVKQVKITELHDIWTKQKLATGKYTSSQLYPSPSDPALLEEYNQWLEQEKKKLGLE